MKNSEDIKRIAILTSGGDAPGLNACIRAVVRAGIFYDYQVWGLHEGFDGLIIGTFDEMTATSVSNIIHRGGTILKSSRSEAFRTAEGKKIAFENLNAADIDVLIVIGGDGSFAGAHSFFEETRFPVIGIPKTIDNDINGTDYSIGFDTSLNTVMEAVDRIRDTAESHHRIFFVEVMGREAGFIAAYSAIATGAEAVLMPEKKNDKSHLFELLQNGWNRKKSSLIVIVAEGDENGGAIKVSEEVKKRFPHYDVHSVVLGHIQRGGSPSSFDRVLASRLGVFAIEKLKAGFSDIMVGQVHGSCRTTPLKEAQRRTFPKNDFLLRMTDILSH